MRAICLAGLTIASCLTIASELHAQIGQNETSLLGGVVSSTLAGESADNVSRKYGLMGELQLVHPFTTQIGLQTGLGIVQKGASLALGGGTTDKSQLKLSYFEVPLMLRIGFAGRYADVRPAVFFGPIAALNVGCKYNVATQGGGNFESDCEPDGPEIKAFDFSLAAGASAEFRNFGAFARYDHGLVTVDNSDAGDKVFNSAIIVGVIWNTSSR